MNNIHFCMPFILGFYSLVNYIMSSFDKIYFCNKKSPHLASKIRGFKSANNEESVEQIFNKSADTFFGFTGFVSDLLDGFVCNIFQAAKTAFYNRVIRD